MITKHTHRLKRYRYPKTGNTVYFCTLPDCQFKIDCALSLGKRVMCNICGSEFIMNEYTVKLAKPHCDDCSKQKVKGDDGKNYYVRRQLPNIVSAMAADSTNDLRSRLTSITDSTIQNTEDDIEL